MRVHGRVGPDGTGSKNYPLNVTGDTLLGNELPSWECCGCNILDLLSEAEVKSENTKDECWEWWSRLCFVVVHLKFRGG